MKALRPDVRVVGVQAEGAAAYPPSLAAGRPVALSAVSTMADGIKVARPGDVPFRIVSALVDEVRTVSEDAISSGLLLCLERAKLVVEPAGASPVAALLSAPARRAGARPRSSGCTLRASLRACGSARTATSCSRTRRATCPRRRCGARTSVGTTMIS